MVLQGLKKESKPKDYEVRCGKHGWVKAMNVQKWSKEATKDMRELGVVGPREEYITGDCPLCRSTLTARPKRRTS